jgi:hypothetical protein
MLVAQSFGQVNFSDVHKSGTIICPEGSWYCVSNYQSPVFISQ